MRTARPFSCRYGGFTLIEVLVSIAIMGIIIGTVFINYGTFTSRSLLRVRVAELGEYVRFAQESSGAAENLSKSTASPDGFQVVRLKVREGKLELFRLEKAPGIFTSFAEGESFALGRDSVVQETRQVRLGSSERYYVDVCFIDEEGSPRYTRKQLTVNNDTACATDSMLCSVPNPTAAGYNEAQTERNNFDIHLSVEQPSREVHANVIPVTIARGSETSQYENTEPNGASSRMSTVYEGVRIVFITEKGDLRSIDMFQTGLIGFRAKDSGNGCS